MSHRSPDLTRRFVLGGLLAGAAAPAVADAPLRSPRPARRGVLHAQARRGAMAPEARDLIAEARLGGRVTFAVADARTGRVLESADDSVAMPPASVAKAITSLYAMEALGPGYRFGTRLIAAGPIRNGRLDGDLILSGSGDPTLDTDALAAMAAALPAAGLREVSGRFLIHDGALPYVRSIDPGQPDHVGYSPSVSGLNLNFNRVHFEWRRAQEGYQVAMDARSETLRPAVTVARMRVAERRAPIYTYEDRNGIDDWSVASEALGRDGSRWLPVRRPGDYAGEVFQILARAQGLTLPRPSRLSGVPTGTVLVEHMSDDLVSVLTGMLNYSTNLTAEAVGLAASTRRGGAPATLAASGERMCDWLIGRTGAEGAHFVDHSGLGPDSRISAGDMVTALVQSGADGALRPMMKRIDLKDEKGRKLRPQPFEVRAKTGTLNFVSGLAGYVEAPSSEVFAFAIFCADIERRRGLGPDEMERPAGGRGWISRAHQLQQKLIERWVAVHSA